MGTTAGSIRAEIFRDQRKSERVTVQLRASFASPASETNALIHDLSGEGLKLETAADLKIGEAVFVDLPHIGTTEARVVRRENSTFGCEFVTPVSKAVVSAALLRSKVSVSENVPKIDAEEIEVAQNPSLEQLTKWQIEFAETKVPAGYQLLGFRQRSDGVIVAIVVSPERS